ncbi:hypothetical protein CASFOL_035786 [Castilleja foliolosa]|uniref:Phytocyanin domain-containing protein n=1 Tax=Castilleja foliolosa TaxID=1961234 RepID=A0ABD3BUV0_9LAMI
MAEIRSSATAVMIMVTMSMLFQNQLAVEAITHIVSWPNHFENFIAKKGDIIDFVNVGAHNMVEVNADGYNTCKTGGAEPVPNQRSVQLNKPGDILFICNVGDHCSKFNMKINITVT